MQVVGKTQDIRMNQLASVVNSKQQGVDAADKYWTYTYNVRGYMSDEMSLPLWQWHFSNGK